MAPGEGTAAGLPPQVCISAAHWLPSTHGEGSLTPRLGLFHPPRFSPNRRPDTHVTAQGDRAPATRGPHRVSRQPRRDTGTSATSMFPASKVPGPPAAAPRPLPWRPPGPPLTAEPRVLFLGADLANLNGPPTERGQHQALPQEVAARVTETLRPVRHAAETRGGAQEVRKKHCGQRAPLRPLWGGAG